MLVTCKYYVNATLVVFFFSHLRDIKYWKKVFSYDSLYTCTHISRSSISSSRILIISSGPFLGLESKYFAVAHKSAGISLNLEEERIIYSSLIDVKYFFSFPIFSIVFWKRQSIFKMDFIVIL